MKDSRVKLSILSLPLALLAAGCSSCPQTRHAETALSVNEAGQGACTRRSWDSAAAYKLSDLASQTVFDKQGHEVARLDDLVLSASGRVVSVTLAPMAANGATVTVPFEKLRIKKERSGALTLETDVVFKAPQENASPAQPHKWFRSWKKPA
jgi:sporulation protein YlmC with PRC-barrel domain